MSEKKRTPKDRLWYPKYSIEDLKGFQEYIRREIKNQFWRMAEIQYQISDLTSDLYKIEEDLKERTGVYDHERWKEEFKQKLKEEKEEDGVS